MVQGWARWTAVGGSTALALALLTARAAPADEAAGPPTLERVQADEASGHAEEAIAGWAARATGCPAESDRVQALRRYVDLAAKSPSTGDPWILDAVARSGAGVRVVAGRRVVAVMTDEHLAGADPGRVAALLDAVHLACERIADAKPVMAAAGKDDKRPRDRAGRFVLGFWGIPKPASDQFLDGWAYPSEARPRGTGVVWPVAGTFSGLAIAGAANRRARLLAPSIGDAVQDVVVREIGEASAVSLADEVRTNIRQRLEAAWNAGCLPGEWLPFDQVLASLFFEGLDAERAAKREPADALRALLSEPRKDLGWGRRRVASTRDLAFEPLAAVMCPGFCDVLRRAGAMPVGRAFDEMKARVSAEQVCQEARDLADENAHGMAANMYRNAADLLAGEIAADELIVDALEQEAADRGDAKKLRATVKKLGLIEGFDFLGPLPEGGPKGDAPYASRLLPLAVASAGPRHPMKLKEPVEVSLKWEEIKENGNPLVQRTALTDRRGSWNGATVAVMKWTKDLGRLVRLRPCRAEWSDVVVLADGRPADRWADGSVLVPGAKGTEIVLASPSRMVVSVPWRDAASVDKDLAADAAEKDPVNSLRPWAARRVDEALPAITQAILAQPDDASLVRALRLLAPYRGGNAASFDAVLARVRGKAETLGAYLDICRGNRDPAVLDRLVALATAPDAAAETLTRVQYVLDGALFRKVAEKGADLAALWERGRKWMAGVAFAEAEEMRDLHDAAPCFRVVADAAAWGRACMAASGWNANRGEGYLCVDVPEGPGGAWLGVRWRGTGGRLTLRGYITDGRKQKPFTLDMPAPMKGEEYAIDAFDLGPIPRGRIVVAFEDPCGSGCRIDAFSIGSKPLD